MEHGMSDELELDPCKHGEQNRAFCSICRDMPKEQRKIVYFTSGGQHFHFSPGCSALAEGQEMVKQRGGTPATLESGFLDTVRANRKPCRTCSS
jgi:hypothetical protein